MTVIRAAAYCRCSTSEQKIDLQVDAVRELAERRGWALTAIFEDCAVSGTKAKRPALDELMNAVRRKKIDVVIVWRTDRLFRSLSHLVATMGELEARGINFVSCTENMDTGTPSGRLIFQIAGAFAEFERNILVERTVAGIAAARRRGARIGRPRNHAIDLDLARHLLGLGRSMASTAAELQVPRTTLRRALAENVGSGAV